MLKSETDDFMLDESFRILVEDEMYEYDLEYDEAEAKVIAMLKKNPELLEIEE